MGIQHQAEPLSRFENRLKSLRVGRGLSQGQLADSAGVTRQAIYAIEDNQYLPTTMVALRLASALGCRVEDLFSLGSTSDVLEGHLIGTDVQATGPIRVKVARVGDRMVVLPVASLGETLNFSVGADGLLMGAAKSGPRRTSSRVRVQLLRDRREIESQVVIAGCDPAIYLAGDYLRRRPAAGMLVGWSMGSAAAIEALKRREVHVAGLHVVDARTGESNLPYVRRNLKGQDVTVVTFASWQQGLMVKKGNPKHLRGIEELARKDITIVNRETGAGARLLLDQKLTAAGLIGRQVNGYQRVAGSHLEVARLIAEGQADAGIGTPAVAQSRGLDFIELQTERYDLVIPTPYVSLHRGVADLLDMMTSRTFRAEVEALGGYDMRETGKVQAV
ncbi:MAG: helix-turn-helix domain-containing protein [Nitrospiraceae bacterium]|nr:helix-turn-helix domain-containing protein [Nitrospiraceae bacterium]MSR23545.1 helix-turn-helix domain-containing protein [Nitrospiraceae bacterium]